MSDPDSPITRFQTWRASLPPALRLLLTINVVLFIALIVLSVAQLGGLAVRWTALTGDPAVAITRPWTVLTHGFINPIGGQVFWGLLSFVFALAWLTWMGRDMENTYGSHQLLGLYLLATLVGSAFALAWGATGGAAGARLYTGAWGPVGAVVVAIGVLHPRESLNLFLLGAVPMKWIAIAFVGFDFLSTWLQASFLDASHVGAYATGAVFALAQRRNVELGAWTRVLLRGEGAEPDPMAQYRASQGGGGGMGRSRGGNDDGEAWKRAAKTTTKASGGRQRPSRAATPAAPTQRDIDAILEKIHAKGAGQPLEGRAQGSRYMVGRLSPSAATRQRPATRPSLAHRVLGAALWLLALPLLAAVVVGLAAQWIDPRTVWWPQLFAVVLPFLSFGLVATALLSMLLKARVLALVQVVLLLFVLVRTEPWARLGGDDAAASGDTAAASGERLAMRLVTFNVPEHLAPEAMRDSMTAFARREAPDVLAMQDAWVRGPRQEREAWEAPQVRGVVDSLGYALRVPRLVPGQRGWKRGATGIPLLLAPEAGTQAARVVEQEAIAIAGPGDDESSQATRSVLEWQGRRFVLYNVHLRSFGEAKPWLDPEFTPFKPRTWPRSFSRLSGVYRERATDVDMIVSAIERETLPVIIAGDFNSTADNWSYRELRQAGGTRRQDAYREAGDTIWGRTYHADNLIVRIDHILVDPALVVERAEMRNVGFSDHRPVLSRIRWRDE